MLHYVGLVEPDSTESAIVSLAGHCKELATGFNRLNFSDGKVLLTLCVGERKTMLRAQNFAADSIFLTSGQSALWDDWAIQALLRCCRRGTQLNAAALTAAEIERLAKHGFDIQTDQATADLRACFNPRWPIQSARRDLNLSVTPASNCVVIGAGLAGASTAASLARRGWRVQVLDAAASPANAASGLPVGLIVAPATSDKDVRSHLLRAGVMLTMAQAREHLTNEQDWAQSGVMTAKPGQATRWEDNAAWIKPQQLVKAWLAQPGVQFRGNARVVSMEPAGGKWILRDARGTVLAQADLVVMACAGGAQTLASEAGVGLRQPMAAIHGQVSWAMQQEFDQSDLPAFPVNGLGHLLPNIPADSATAWFAGATYASIDNPVPSAAIGHAANLSKLGRLHPPSGQLMERRVHDGSIQAWQGTRFTTQDRMPLVGPLIDSGSAGGSADGVSRLYINSGYGSRGLSWSVLCGELLAAQIGLEPLAMPYAQARLLRGHP